MHHRRAKRREALLVDRFEVRPAAQQQANNFIPSVSDRKVKRRIAVPAAGGVDVRAMVQQHPGHVGLDQRDGLVKRILAITRPLTGGIDQRRVGTQQVANFLGLFTLDRLTHGLHGRHADQQPAGERLGLRFAHSPGNDGRLVLRIGDRVNGQHPAVDGEGDRQTLVALADKRNLPPAFLVESHLHGLFAPRAFDGRGAYDAATEGGVSP